GSPLLERVTFAVERGEHWGMLGRNGSGKTTLLRVLTGDVLPHAGQVVRSSGLRVAWMDQHRDFGDAVTVWGVAAAPFAALQALEESLARQADALAHDASPSSLDRYSRDQERFDREGGYSWHSRVDAVLHGLGFEPDEARSRAAATLSGGEQGRLDLARQLVQPADILLLDEPTNHLDLETTGWLAAWLQQSDVASILVSHDRDFLDRVTDHILHLEGGTAIAYAAGYRRFLEQRAAQRLAQERAQSKQERAIAAEEDYIRRNIAGGNSRQAKGRRKRLARLPRLGAPPSEEDVMAFRLHPAARSGDQVLVTDHLSLVVDGRELVKDFSTRVTRGERIGCVGPNGAGKTTLLRALTGERPADGGT
ncbi:MAG: ABC-F family ATP-binding cassette domain-containing protein, partial [Gemmatimonadales bacterium]